MAGGKNCLVPFRVGLSKLRNSLRFRETPFSEIPEALLNHAIALAIANGAQALTRWVGPAVI